MIYSYNKAGGYITASMESPTKALPYRISEEEYRRIVSAVNSYPHDGGIYRLREDLTWEPIQDDPDVDVSVDEIVAEFEGILKL